MREIAILAWRHLSRRQSRTALTILGVAIGFGAIIAILSLTYGVRKSVEERLDPLATDVMILPMPKRVTQQPMPLGSGRQIPGLPSGAGRRPIMRIQTQALDNRTLQELISLPGVKGYAARSTAFSVKALWNEREIQMYAVAINPEAERNFGQLQIVNGTWPSYMEALATEVFVRLGSISPGDKITLINVDEDQYEVRISGIVAASREARFGLPPNAPLLMDFETASLFANETGYAGLVLEAESREKAQSLAEMIQDTHPNLTVLSFQQFSEAIENTLSQYTVFLLSIGILSVAVAALGTANTMIVSAMERTREIGIMKATGAKDNFILKGFLFESALIGLVGGITGVVLGYLGSKILEVLVIRLNIARMGANAFSPYIPIWLIPFSIGLAVLITVLSGFYPAWRASKLDPVEAIRYE